MMTHHYQDLGSASDWSCHLGNLIQSIRNTTQIWVVTHHQYGIFPARFSDVIWRGNPGLSKCATGAIASYFLVFAGCRLFEKSEKWTIIKSC